MLSLRLYTYEFDPTTGLYTLLLDTCECPDVPAFRPLRGERMPDSDAQLERIHERLRRGEYPFGHRPEPEGFRACTEPLPARAAAREPPTASGLSR